MNPDGTRSDLGAYGGPEAILPSVPCGGAGNQSPVPRFTMCSGSTCVGQNGTLGLTVPAGQVTNVNFSAVNSFDPDGVITQYHWFINGTALSSSASFTTGLGVGSHQVLLTVTDNLGTSASVGASVTVQRFAQSPPVPSAVSDGFDYPVSSVFRPTRTQGDSDGWFVLNFFGNNLQTPPCTFHFHPGDDWNRDDGKDAGETVKAVSNGNVEGIRVLRNSEGTALGQGIVISHKLPNGSTVFSVYIHVTVNPLIFPGKSVARGQPIATIAKTVAFGPHLHFEMRTSINLSDWYPQDDGCGYYDSIGTILSRGFIDPVVFVDAHRP